MSIVIDDEIIQKVNEEKALKKSSPKEEKVQRRFYNLVDIQKIFGMGRNKALNLVREKDFPAIKIGHTYYVDMVNLENWIKEHYGTEVYIKD